jgi:hypothetical protein
MGGESKMENLIFAYTLNQAIEDGVLHPLGWAKGKPLIGTARIVAELPENERQQLFEEFLEWQRETEPTLPEEERLFAATSTTGQTVWVLEDGQAITLLYPDEY